MKELREEGVFDGIKTRDDERVIENVLSKIAIDNYYSDVLG